MIWEVELHNFKCFESQKIPLRGLTVLSGQNGMGKSSVLQSLLLLRQSLVRGMLPSKGLLLNGDLLQVGTAQDLLYESAQTDIIRVSLHHERDWHHWQFDASDRRSDVLKVLGAPSADWNMNGIRHLSAERIGPREVHAVSEYQVETLRDVGQTGVFTVAYLERHADEAVNENLVAADAPTTRLSDQVDAWMGEISPGVRLIASPHPEVNRASMQVNFLTGGAKSRSFRPTNVGFGISYTLPVVVTLLSARSGDTLLIENPEAHLHPRGQMALGELIARTAGAGIQVVVETHSDHVLNGIRICTKRGQIRHDNVALHWFSRGETERRIRHTVVSPQMDKDGRINHWPEGFFDQWEAALDQLL